LVARRLAAATSNFFVPRRNNSGSFARLAESLTKKACNGLLQQNRPKADIAVSQMDVRFQG
jgi:hypothetical protein